MKKPTVTGVYWSFLIRTLNNEGNYDVRRHGQRYDTPETANIAGRAYVDGLRAAGFDWLLRGGQLDIVEFYSDGTALRNVTRDSTDWDSLIGGTK